VTRLSERLFGGHVDETAWDAIDYAEVRRHADALLDEDTVRLTRR
jgi:hypothetical protein